jgi:hypothetical protein
MGTLNVRKGERTGSLLNTGTDRHCLLFQSISMSKGFLLLQVMLHSFSLYANGTGKVLREDGFRLEIGPF